MDFKFNAPNTITLIRVSLIPLFVFVLLANIPYKTYFSAFIFLMLSISDMFDGYLARKKQQVTDFGKLIDPIADKLLISTALIFLTLQHKIPFWITAVIISREVILTAVRIYLIPSKIIIPAELLGKIKTIVQSITIIFLLLEAPFGFILLYAAAFLTLASGFEYLINIRKKTGIKVVNLPNLITLSRFLLIIPYCYYFLDKKFNFVIVLFSIITLSDKLDGVFARLMNQKTELGSSIDSFTDWTLINLTLFLLCLKGHLSYYWFFALVIPCFVSGTMKMYYAKQLKTVPVTPIAKLSVGMIYISILLLLFEIGFNINFGLNELILTSNFLTIAVVLAYIAMAGYVFKALKVKKWI